MGSKMIAVIGFRKREFLRLKMKVRRLPGDIELINGGHIEDGSNAASIAERAIEQSDLVVWRPEGMRHFPPGVHGKRPIHRVRGVSGACKVLWQFA